MPRSCLVLLAAAAVTAGWPRLAAAQVDRVGLTTAPGPFFENDPIDITVQAIDGNGSPAAIQDVQVTLAATGTGVFSVGGQSTVTVTTKANGVAAATVRFPDQGTAGVTVAAATFGGNPLPGPSNRLDFTIGRVVPAAPFSEVAIVNGGAVRACATNNEGYGLEVRVRDDKQIASRSDNHTFELSLGEPHAMLLEVVRTELVQPAGPGFMLTLGSNRCTPEGTRSVELIVDNVPLATLDLPFACPNLDPAASQVTAKPPEVRADGIATSDITVQLVDECGNPGFGREITLVDPDDALILDFATAVTLDNWDAATDGIAIFTGRSSRVYAPMLEIHTASTVIKTIDDPEPPLTFTPLASFLDISAVAEQEGAVLGDRVEVTVRVASAYTGEMSDVRLVPILENVRIHEVKGGGWDELGDQSISVSGVHRTGSVDVVLDVQLTGTPARIDLEGEVTFPGSETPLVVRALTLTLDVDPRSPYRYYGCTSVPGAGSLLALCVVAFALVRRRLGMLLVLLLFAGPAAAEERPKLAFAGVAAATGVEEGVALAVSEFIQSALHEMGHYEIIGPGEISAILDLERQRQLLGCQDDSACISELAGALGAQRLVTGNLARLGGSLLVNLSLVDAEAARVIARRGKRVPVQDSVEPVLDVLPELLASLVSEDPVVGPVSEPAAPELSLPPLDSGSRGWRVFLAFRGDTDLTGGPTGLVPNLSVSLVWPRFALAAGVVVVPTRNAGAGSTPAGLRAEARYRFLSTGSVQPYVGAGAVALLPEAGVRAAVGTELPIGRVRMVVEAAFEYFLTTDWLVTPYAVLLSGGVGLEL